MTNDNMMDVEDDNGYVYILISVTTYKGFNTLGVFNDLTLAVEAKTIAESVKPNRYSIFSIHRRKVSTSFEGQDELDLINMVKG